jgi:hypothetical protein
LRSSLYGGRRGEAFGPAGFLCDRSVNLAPSVTLFDSGATDFTSQRKSAMPTASRAVRARLRARHQARRRAIDAALNELAASQLALHTAAGAIAAAFHAQMIDGDGAYELLITVHNRQAIALGQLDRAVNAKGGAA